MAEPVPVPDPHGLVDDSLLHAVEEAVIPRLRGLSHLVAFPLSLVGIVALTALAQGPRADVAAIIFGCSVSAIFGTSGAYHRVPWPVPIARWARRIDHSMIFVSMAGVYTALWVAQLHGRPVADSLLVIAWIGAVLGITLKLAWLDAPKSVSIASYLVLGLSGVLAIPQIVATAGLPAMLVLLGAGCLQAIGAFVYCLERPDPIPHLFGYHELFHLLVTIGLGLQFVVFALWILPR